MTQSGYSYDIRNKAIAPEGGIPEQPLAAIEGLRQELSQLKQENADLEILLENTTEHSTQIEIELHEKNEKMQAYLQHVHRVTAAAAAVEDGTFQSTMLNDVVLRDDELGQLARVFQQMIAQVKQREEKLKQQVEELKIEIDQTRRAQQVSQITQTDYFRELKQKVKQMRSPVD